MSLTRPMTRLPEPPVILRRRVPPQTEEFLPGVHPSLTSGYRYVAFPATGREAVPYFAGYMAAVSVAPGDELAVHVATRSSEACYIDIYRVTGCEDAHLHPKLSFVQRFGPVEPHRLPQSAGGRLLGPGDADSEGCRWPKVSLLDSVPNEWPSGVYVAQFCADEKPRERATHRAGEDALFIVRRGSGRPGAQILCQVNVATWLAYHIWHNRSLYHGRSDDGQYWEELRNSKASIHRPGLGLCYPNGNILGPYPPKSGHTFAFIDWLEREGISVDFCSGLDISNGYANLSDYSALVTIGHDEYWTGKQLDAVRGFRDSGGATIFLGGNLACYLVRETSDSTAIECYKASGDHADSEHGDGGESLDPLHAAAPSPLITGFTWHLRPESTTTTTGVYNYTRRPGAPQEVLTGGMFWYWELFGGPSRPKCGFTVCDPEHWVFNGAGVGDGDTFGAEIKLLGHEADGLEVEPNGPRPKLTFADGALPGTRLLAFADCRRWGEWDFGGWPAAYKETSGPRETLGSLGGFVTMVVHEEPGKGILFNAPTADWVFGLVESIDWTATRSLEPPVLPADAVVEQITRNILLRCSTRQTG